MPKKSDKSEFYKFTKKINMLISSSMLGQYKRPPVIIKPNQYLATQKGYVAGSLTVKRVKS